MNHFKRAFAGAAASIALGAGLLGVTGGSASASAAGTAGVQAAASSHGCPSGYVCIYPSSNWNGDRPSHKYSTSGVHKLYNQEGWHRIYNNQTDGWTVQMCTGGSGTGCGDRMGPGWYVDQNLSPINSIRIRP